MADKIIAASLRLDSSQAENSVKSFKTQLREANQELVQTSTNFGATSKEAVNAAKRVAELKDRMGDAKNLADAFNPDAKFRAFSNTIRGVAGGFSALQGTMALLGQSGEDVQKTLLKVQAALAISDGVNNILELKDTFQQLGSFIKSTTVFQKLNTAATKAAAFVTKLFGASVETTATSFKVLKGAIVATGIGVLVILVGEAVQAFNELTSATDNAAEAQKEYDKTVVQSAKKTTNNLIERATLEKNLLLAKANTEEEKFKIEQDFRRKSFVFTEQEYDRVKKLDEDAAEDSLNNLKKINNEGQVAAINEEKRRQKLSEDAAKQRSEKAASEAKQNAERRKSELQQQQQAELSALDQLEKAKQDNILARIKDEEKQAKQKEEFDFQNSVKEIESLKVKESIKTQLIAEATEKRSIAIAAIEKEFEDKRQKQREEALGNAAAGGLPKEVIALQESLAVQLELKRSFDDAEKTELQLKNEALDKWYNEKRQIVFGNEQLELQLIESYEKQKTALQKEELRQRLDIASNLLGQAANLFSKDTAAYKVLAVAQATINTYSSATAAYASMAKIPVVGPALGIAAAGLAIATGLKNIKEIVKVKVPGGGSGGSVPNVSANVSAPLTPQPQVQTTQLDQQSINNSGNAAVRAFVVESDIENNRERISRLSRAARLGG